MKTNAQVAAAFASQQPARGLNMTSTGTTLYSYATPIAVWSDGRVLLTTQKFYSPGYVTKNGNPRPSLTTTRHRGEAMMALHDAGYNGPPPWDDWHEERDTTTFEATGGQATDPAHPAVIWTYDAEHHRQRQAWKEKYTSARA